MTSLPHLIAQLPVRELNDELRRRDVRFGPSDRKPDLIDLLIDYEEEHRDVVALRCGEIPYFFSRIVAGSSTSDEVDEHKKGVCLGRS